MATLNKYSNNIILKEIKEKNITKVHTGDTIEVGIDLVG